MSADAQTRTLATRRGSRGEKGARQVAVHVGAKHSTARSSPCLVPLRRTWLHTVFVCASRSLDHTHGVFRAEISSSTHVCISAGISRGPNLPLTHSWQQVDIAKKKQKKNPTNYRDINKNI